MRSFAIFFCLIFFANAFDMDISYGKEKKNLFSIITLKAKKDFLCEKIMRSINADYIIQCKIDAIPENGFLPFETKFFKISYQMEKQVFILSIYPKKEIELFYIPDDIQENNLFFEEKKSLSKTWQIVGYEKNLPFLTKKDKNQKGINFPITLGNPQFNYVDEINIDKNPLKASVGADYADYLKIKDLMKQKYYKTALNAISSTFRKFPNTFFAKDLLFYQIQALYHLNLVDNVLENAPAWIKQYPSDNEVPEVLYMLGNTYAKIYFPTEAMHFYKRIIEEYPENRFTPLAKMQIAKTLSEGTNIGMARIYFSQAYQEAKDLDSVTDIALNWAFFEINTNNAQNARDLIDKILEANPTFFTQNPEQTKNTIIYLSEKHIYDSAAKIADYYFHHTKDDDKVHEELGFMLGELYEKAKDYDKAHSSNLAFIKEYESFPKAREVQKRDDAMLFEVSGSDSVKLERYDYILKKYPNTPQATKAAELKTKILIKQQDYEDALAMKPFLPANSTLYNEALLGMIDKNIQENQCQKINPYLIEMTDFSGIKDKLKAFDCLYNNNLFTQALKVAQTMLQDKNNPDYIAWLYRNANTLFALGKYQDSIIAIQDVLSLAKNKKTKKYEDIYFTLFSSLARLDFKDRAKEIYNKLYENFKDDRRMLQVYATLLNWGDAKNTTTIVYAKNLIALQERYKTQDFTPFVEFKLIEALSQNNQTQEAYTIAQELVKKNLRSIDLQKAFYIKADLEIKLKENTKALESLKSCINIQEDSTWKTLCKQSQTLFKGE
ncbi:flagellar protein [Helicobacter anseris]|uniref:Flagellar protein n=1 Tax=Helicobacter anseris TaxID=375926 RepID=A0A3D8J5R3_9HELI|nr:outer membrane protein assembly factor BamD [Helicobacter anseris]RDU72788.1 flagellar protein [Helicobacter anseris]